LVIYIEPKRLQKEPGKHDVRPSPSKALDFRIKKNSLAIRKSGALQGEDLRTLHYPSLILQITVWQCLQNIFGKEMAYMMHSGCPLCQRTQIAIPKACKNSEI
jgi:hypothetical protein